MGIRNKVIVIDPGHGGSQKGAVGYNGLKEKDVNLKVALWLWKLLKKECANVILTREKDEEISLAERVKISRDANTDLFLSIHHNANAQLDRSINRTEIYYPWRGECPSLDFANILFNYFSEYLKLLTLPPLPAKYRVLRGNVEPSVLGEACYISNPAAEAKLGDEEYNKLEATIYFKSIIDYFEREIPKVTNFKLSHNILLANFQDIDPSTIKLRVDSKDIPYTYDHKSNILTAPYKGENGRHIASLSARNRRGNITQPCTIEFFIDNPPEDIHIHFYPTSIPKKGKTPVSLYVDVVDAQANPVGDNKLVKFKTDSGTLSFNSRFTKGGKVSNSLTLEEGKGTLSLRVKCEKSKAKKEIKVTTTDKSILTGIVHNKNQLVHPASMHRCGVKGAMVETKESISLTDENGRYYLFTEPGKTIVTIKKRGFYKTKRECDIPDGTGINLDIELKPIFDGLLLGKRIIIDPADSSSLTLDVTRHIRDFLYISGADSLLTRNGIHEKVGEVERTRFVISQNPDRLISVSHFNKYQKDGSRCYYYYTDKESQKFAKVIQKYIVRYGERADLGVGESSSYMIIQSHCKRTLVVPGNLSEDVFRNRLKSYFYRIKEAYLIFCGILEDMGLQPNTMGSLMGRVIGRNNRPVDNVSVLVSNGQRLITQDDGGFHFLYLDPGDTNVLFSKGDKWVERDTIIKSGEASNMEVIL
jgi:N-acetylmuramoyl-L-alanine amidase